MNGREELVYPLGPALEFLERLWALNHALEKLSGKMLERLGVTARQRLIIRCVGRYPGIPAGHLATLLHLDPGTISAALRRLEGKGLVVRRRDPRDHRRSALGLTVEGRELDREAPGTVEHVVERLLSSEEREDLEGAVRVLERLTHMLAEEGDDGWRVHRQTVRRLGGAPEERLGAPRASLAKTSLSG